VTDCGHWRDILEYIENLSTFVSVLNSSSYHLFAYYVGSQKVYWRNLILGLIYINYLVGKPCMRLNYLFYLPINSI